MTAKGKPPADYGPIQLAEHTGLPRWLTERAVEAGLIPAPDVGSGRWSGAVADDIARRAEKIKAAIGAEHPIGAARAAERVSARAGVEVDRADIRMAADQGLLHAVGEHKGWPLYDCRDLDELDVTLLEPFIVERQAWMAASVTRYEAADRLGWRLPEFERTAKQRGVEPGRFGRYATVDVEALAGDEELDEQVRGARLVGAVGAAALLEIRPRDFDYCVAAGWVSPADHADYKISRRREIVVPLYRVAEVLAVLDTPGVDWEAVRAVRPGQPSVLREFVALPTSRGTLVRGFAADLSAKHGVEVEAQYVDDQDMWMLEWTATAGGEPSSVQVRQALRADRDLAPYSSSIALRVTVPEDVSDVAEDTS
jgi:hypothetical protein